MRLFRESQATLLRLFFFWGANISTLPGGLVWKCNKTWKRWVGDGGGLMEHLQHLEMNGMCFSSYQPVSMICLLPVFFVAPPTNEFDIPRVKWYPSILQHPKYAPAPSPFWWHTIPWSQHFWSACAYQVTSRMNDVCLYIRMSQHLIFCFYSVSLLLLHSNRITFYMQSSNRIHGESW